MLKHWVQHISCIFVLAIMRPTYKYPSFSLFFSNSRNNYFQMICFFFIYFIYLIKLTNFLVLLFDLEIERSEKVIQKSIWQDREEAK